VEERVELDVDVDGGGETEDGVDPVVDVSLVHCFCFCFAASSSIIVSSSSKSDSAYTSVAALAAMADVTLLTSGGLISFAPWFQLPIQIGKRRGGADEEDAWGRGMDVVDVERGGPRGGVDERRVTEGDVEEAAAAEGEVNGMATNGGGEDAFIMADDDAFALDGGEFDDPGGGVDGGSSMPPLSITSVTVGRAGLELLSEWLRFSLSSSNCCVVSNVGVDEMSVAGLAVGPVGAMAEAAPEASTCSDVGEAEADKASSCLETASAGSCSLILMVLRDVWDVTCSCWQCGAMVQGVIVRLLESNEIVKELVKRAKTNGTIRWETFAYVRGCMYDAREGSSVE